MLNLYYDLSLVVLLAGGASFWVQLYPKLKSQGTILQPTAATESPLGLVDVGIMFLCYVTAISLTDSAGLAAIGSLVGTLSSVGIICLRYRACGSIFGLQRKTAVRNLRIGAVAFLMIVPAVLLLQRLLALIAEYQHPTIENMQQDFSLSTIASSWFAAVLVAPVCEEIFFRGTLQAWMHRTQEKKRGDHSMRDIFGGWGDDADGGKSDVASSSNERSERMNDPATLPAALMWLPILTSALLFAVVHIGQGLAPIPLFALGIGLGYVYRQSRSVIPCIVIHMLLNGYGMFWATLSVAWISTLE
jgi:membrane protease YdiL (CAAX protease family)